MLYVLYLLYQKVAAPKPEPSDNPVDIPLENTSSNLDDECAKSLAHPAVLTVTARTTQPSSSPPLLHYSLHTRKVTITIFWSLVLIDSVILPIALYFTLWYCVSRDALSANSVFSIITGAIGGVALVEYLWRIWCLLKPISNCRSIGAKRFYVGFLAVMPGMWADNLDGLVSLDFWAGGIDRHH
jgi:hypothetical protein